MCESSSRRKACVCNVMISYAGGTAFVASASLIVQLFVFLIVGFARTKCFERAMEIFGDVENSQQGASQ